MKHFYFADYELQLGSATTRWGNTTLEYDVDDDQPFDPEVVVRKLRERAADKYGAQASEVRLRNVCRL